MMEIARPILLMRDPIFALLHGLALFCLFAHLMPRIPVIIPRIGVTKIKTPMKPINPINVSMPNMIERMPEMTLNIPILSEIGSAI